MRCFAVSAGVFSAAIALLLPVLAAANESGHHGRNIFEIFLGATFEDHHGKSEEALTGGVQYRYAVNETVSVGLLAERADSPLNFWVVGVPAVFNLGTSGWQLTAMPGLEIKDSKEKFLFRAGVGYEFEMQGGYSLKPEVNVDWVDGETALVTGVNIGWRF